MKDILNDKIKETLDKVEIVTNLSRKNFFGSLLKA
jgi:hypothetical protein